MATPIQSDLITLNQISGDPLVARRRPRGLQINAAHHRLILVEKSDLVVHSDAEHELFARAHRHRIARLDKIGDHVRFVETPERVPSRLEIGRIGRLIENQLVLEQMKVHSEKKSKQI